MSEKPGTEMSIEEQALLVTAAVRQLGKAAPQIFKRDGSVKACPRKLVIKQGFMAKLQMYNMTKKAIQDNLKYDIEPAVTFCTAEFSITIRGALAVLLTAHSRDILAEIIDAGWMVC